MKIIKDVPPNFAAILRVFPGATGEGVIFAYAPDIYAPYVENIGPEFLAHESVHIARQEAIGVEEWWNKYLVDPTFRYEEELLAHRAEYQKLMEMTPTRQVRRSALKQVAKKLAAPLYGKIISVDQAMKDIAA